MILAIIALMGTTLGIWWSYSAHSEHNFLPFAETAWMKEMLPPCENQAQGSALTTGNIILNKFNMQPHRLISVKIGRITELEVLNSMHHKIRVESEFLNDALAKIQCFSGTIAHWQKSEAIMHVSLTMERLERFEMGCIEISEKMRSLNDTYKFLYSKTADHLGAEQPPAIQDSMFLLQSTMHQWLHGDLMQSVWMPWYQDRASKMEHLALVQDGMLAIGKEIASLQTISDCGISIEIRLQGIKRYVARSRHI